MSIDKDKANQYHEVTPYARYIGSSIIIHTDAATKANGTKSAQSAIAVFFGKHSPWNYAAMVRKKNYYLLSGVITNNTAEIIAVIRALELAKKYELKNVEIRTDSEWIIRYFQSMRSQRLDDVHRGVRNRYKMDPKVLLRLEEAASQISQVVFTHTKGHRHDLGNLCADLMAKRELALDTKDIESQILTEEKSIRDAELKDKIKLSKRNYAVLSDQVDSNESSPQKLENFVDKYTKKVFSPAECENIGNLISGMTDEQKKRLFQMFFDTSSPPPPQVLIQSIHSYRTVKAFSSLLLCLYLILF